jgi:3-methyladenine DNA glycosylase/8-oxoguanine DNA glycosylase
MKLKKTSTIKITPKPPFHFDSTFHKPSHFPSSIITWEQGTSWQTWLWQNKKLGLKFINKGTTDKPKLLVEIYSKSTPDNEIIKSLQKEIVYRYNLDLDLNDFYKKFKNDKILGPIIKKWRGMRPGHQNSLYEYIIIGIVLQNATVKRSVQMLQSLLENYGKQLEFDNKKLWCFWKPGGLAKVTEEDLRALKIGYRAKFIKKIDTQFAEGEIDEFELRQKDMEAQMEELLNLYGVGPATVWYLLYDVFHHYDFFSHISPWEQKIYSKLFFNKNPEIPVPVEKLLRYFVRFNKYKQLAVHYVWENIWWKRKHEHIPWLEKLIRL